MEHYKNISGDSGVSAFEIDNKSITVQFKDGSVYLYTDQSIGQAYLAEMQRLAQLGCGLNSFIQRNVRKKYAQKLC